MRTKLISSILFITVLIFVIAPELCAQQETQLAPLPLSFRAAATNWPGAGESLFVGDSGVCEEFYGGWQPYFYLDKSVTLLAAAYTSTGFPVVAGTNGKIWYDSSGFWVAGNSGTTATLRAMASDQRGDLFVVGDSGLILESTDRGANWSRLASPVTKQLNAIVFNSTGKSAVAVGNDSAIVVTTDDGKSWHTEAFPYDLSPIGSALNAVNFSAVAISPGGDSVWVGLEKPVLPLLLINGTADPAQQFNVYPNSGPLTSLLYLGDTGRFYVLGYASDDFLYYVDRHGTLEQFSFHVFADADGTIDQTPIRMRCAAFYQPVGGPLGVDMAGDDFSIIYIQYNFPVNIHYPNGVSGSLQSISGHQFTGILLDQDIQPNGKGLGVEVGGGIWYTADSGQTFVFAFRDTSLKLNSVWCAPNTFPAVAIGWDGIILHSEDSAGYIVFQTIPSGTQERLHGIAFPTPNIGIIVGDFGTILRSSDTGNSWHPIAAPTQQYLRSVAFTTPEIGVATGESGAIQRTTDAGQTWSDMNNILTGTNTSIGKVQAFPNGVFLAQAGSNLLRSTDFGQNWMLVPCPGDSVAMSFYNPQIGIIAERSTSSEIVPDTSYLWYTTDGGTTWNPVVVHIWNDNRILVHWRNNHQAILYGIDGFEAELTISTSGVTVTQVSTAPSFSVYPNPSNGSVSLTYLTEMNGPVTIELWDESGKRIQQLFSGEESAGSHTRSLNLPKNLHGNYFIRLSSDGTTSTTKLNIP